MITSEDLGGAGRGDRPVHDGGGVGRRGRVFVLAMLLEVHRRHEALAALDALVSRLHQVDLWLGVPVQVRLRHALVVAQPTHVFPDPCGTQHHYQQVCIRPPVCWQRGPVVSVVRCFIHSFIHSFILNEVTLHRARLVLGWVTVFGQVYRLVCNQPSRSTQPCIPPGSLNLVPASAGVTAGMSPLPCAGNTVWSHMACEFP